MMLRLPTRADGCLYISSNGLSNRPREFIFHARKRARRICVVKRIMVVLEVATNRLPNPLLDTLTFSIGALERVGANSQHIVTSAALP